MEQLGETEMWRCDHCKQLCRAYKRMELWSAPDVLCLQLKRFSTSGFSPGVPSRGGWFGGGAGGSRFAKRRKVKTLVRYPPLLDLAPFLADQTTGGRGGVGHTYELVGVVKHSGDLNGGHYTALARDCAPPPGDQRGAAHGADHKGDGPWTGRWLSCNDRQITAVDLAQGGAPLLSKDAYLLFYERKGQRGKAAGQADSRYGGVTPTEDEEWARHARGRLIKAAASNTTASSSSK